MYGRVVSYAYVLAVFLYIFICREVIAVAAPPPTTPTHDFGLTKTQNSPFCTMRSVDFSSVELTHGFWAERFEQCRSVTLPHLWNLLSDPNVGHALTNLRIAAGLEQGEFAGTHWQDEWVYKWLEAASYVFRATGDKQLDRRMDEVIDIIRRAQQPDGYIATQITLRGWKRFQNPRHHELYVMGHLITAACIHHRMTGKDNFLAIARKVADYLYPLFIETKPELAHFPLNPSIIMALVELYRTTGEKRYLDLAKAFVDRRGTVPGGTDLNQDFVPLRKETQVVGHAVFFTYLYAGAADVYMETGDRSLLEALDRLWHDLTEKKMYVTGGVCALHRGLSIRDNLWAAHDVHEAAGPPYFLPNSTAYNETCAQIGCTMWNWRMLQITGEARFADVMERQLYNSILSGIGLNGKSWFYTNVLRWYGREHRLLSNDAYERFQPGRRHICCPSNLLRTIAKLRGWMYGVSDDGLWVNLYGASTFRGQLPDGSEVELAQETDYPWSGEIELSFARAPQRPFALLLRVPGWAEGAQATVNGAPVEPAPVPGTYLKLQRKWSAGDRVRLVLPMEPRLVEAHPRVEELRGQVCVMRGPIVYCLESPDLPQGVSVWEVRLPAHVKLTARFAPDLLGGVVVLEGEALRVPLGQWRGRLYRPLSPAPSERINIRLIPYFAWANRGVSEMTVWIPLANVP